MIFPKFSKFIFGIVLVVGLTQLATTMAATDPGLGAASTFSIIAQTGITGTATVSGDVGLNSTGAGITALTGAMVSGTIYSTDGISPGLATLPPEVQANLSLQTTTLLLRVQMARLAQRLMV